VFNLWTSCQQVRITFESQQQYRFAAPKTTKASEEAFEMRIEMRFDDSN